MNNPFQYYDKKDIHIPLYDKVTVTEMGNILQIKHSSFHNQQPSAKKLSKHLYINLKTGKLIESKKKTSTKRSESPVSLNRTFQKVGQLVQANVSEPEKVRWVTFTYRENMTDTKRLYEDFRRFYGRLVTYCKKHGWSKPEYISIAEPQGRGSWHLHVFFIWLDQVAPFIPNKDLENLWRHGFTKIKALKKTDNVAGYLVSYLRNIPFEDLPKEQREAKGNLNHDMKRIVKKGRLQFYPASFNIYRHSRGIKLPIIKKMSGFEAFEKVKGALPSYHCRKDFLIADMYDSTFQIVEFKRNADGSWDNPQNTDDGDWEYDLTDTAFNAHRKQQK